MATQASAAFTGWIFDHTRNQYYYYSAEEGAYIYQSGEKVYINAGASSAASATSTCVISLARSP